MNIGKELSIICKNKGITQRWVTEQLQRHISDMTEDKLSRRFRGSIEVTGVELLLIGKYLGIDLNEWKDKI